jgi:hypothetical protein
MSFYDRDPTVPFWRSNVDVDSLFAAHAHRPHRAQAWLKFRETSDATAVMMRGHFEGGILCDHTYHWTFTPTPAGETAIVLPVYENWRLVDLLAISRHDHSLWGCVTGAGQYAGRFVRDNHDRAGTLTLLVHKTPISWLMSNCEGVLPLSKSFFPMLQFAHSIVAQDGDHAWEVAQRAFIYPAERLGLDCAAAEQAAFDRISFEEKAA